MQKNCVEYRQFFELCKYNEDLNVKDAAPDINQDDETTKNMKESDAKKEDEKNRF